VGTVVVVGAHSDPEAVEWSLADEHPEPTDPPVAVALPEATEWSEA